MKRPRRRLWSAALVVTLLGVMLAPTGSAHAAPPDVTADGAVLWDPADDKVLFGIDEGQPLPMASITKIMTVLLALEGGAADDTLTVSAHAAEVGREPGVATLGLEAGEQVPVADVLAGLVLQSGNDGAVAVAEHVAGSEEAFTRLMNARAAELGLDATSFLNASGLTDDPDNYASPRDLARLAEEAMTHERFAAWADAEVLTLSGIGTIANRNELLGDYPAADGVKTGYTALAGYCLVASATRHGRQLITVVLDSQDRFGESGALLTYGFRAFQRAEPVAADAAVTRYRWADATVPLTADDVLGRTVRANRRVRWRTALEPDAALPVAEGQILG
ncbi:MAG: D-alanyl-D-alanine carboxypeptidase family protein, partial [Egibacteraceae bacterium]